MAGIKLYDYQKEAIGRMNKGCILCGGVGSGKSRTALAYYFVVCGGKINPNKYVPMKLPKDLYIITTARKRDSLEWDGELSIFLLSKKPEANFYENKVVIDSWNNIAKYKEVKDAFFIFDEQRVVGKGAWVKSFLAIAKQNDWILLSATPGDTWTDYIPVFIANGFYRNRSEFNREHVIFSRFTKYPKVDRYVNTNRLIRLRDKILIDMNFHRDTISHHEDILVGYDRFAYKEITRRRWNIFKDKPVENAAEMCYLWRRIVNSDASRMNWVLELQRRHGRVIVFYNFDYERDLLMNIMYDDDVEIAEWSGHAHQEIPDCERWVYLVQYTAGCEGWNCVKTDTIIFYSQNYSYKVQTQAAGRIDRLNTPYRDLYYYHLVSKSPIDVAISRAIKNKKNFNESRFVKW